MGRLVVVYGKSGSGKTQLGMQAVLCAAKEGKRTLFVDTEGTFRPERLEGIAKARGWDPEGLLEKIVYLRADSFSEQMEVIAGMSRRSATAGCKLVVIDTLTRNFSLDLPGRSNLAGRQGAIGVHLSEMARDAYLSGRAYLLTNRVTFGPSHEVGIGGRTVEQMVHASVRLEKERDAVRATLMSTGRRALATISESGIN